MATVQIGITVVSAGAAAFGGATLAEDLAAAVEPLGVSPDTGEPVALVFVVVLVSYLSLVLGELVPKSLALERSERYALFAARPLWWLGRISAPFVYVLTASSNVILRVFSDRTRFAESEISRDEVLAVIHRAAGSGEVSPRAGDMARRALELDQLHVGSVMIPRAAIAAIGAAPTVTELAAVLDRSDEERFPVRDARDDLIGYVTTRDLARLLAGRVEGGLGSIVRPLHVVPESARALDVLEQLQSKRIAIALVVDESGGIEGIVDIDDLAEEVVGSLLVGEARDEGRFTPEEDGRYLLPASARVHVVNRRLDVELPVSQRWSTLGGLLMTWLGGVPTVGARAVLPDGTSLEGVETSVRRVLRVRLRKAPTSAPGEVAEDAAART